MALFAIGDLHFGFAQQKPMDKFGENWKNHAQKIIENWKQVVTEADTILLPGDISWAMRLPDVAVDLDIINRLPGKKILLSGNHDYWWKSSAKLEGMYPDIFFLKNNMTTYQDWHICGSRGWLCPHSAYFTQEDEKIYAREAIRLRLSFDAAMRAGATKIVAMLHFPPTNEWHESSIFTEIFAQYPVQIVVYGHLHGAGIKGAFQGEREGISYHLTSCDAVGFCPKCMLA